MSDEKKPGPATLRSKIAEVQAPAPALSDHDSELAKLRAENDLLRHQLTTRPSNLSSEAGPRRRFRTRLPLNRYRDGRIAWLPVKRVRFLVGPREPRRGLPSVPEKYRPLPTEAFDGLEMVAAGQDPTQGAWEHYAAKHHLIEADRTFFKVRAEAGPVEDHLDIEAVSPADAFEVYKRYCGITRTIHQPEVVAVLQE